MMSRYARLCFAASVVCVAAAACAPRPMTDDAAVKETEAFRAKHEADYRKEYVPLAGLFSLSPGANSAGSAEGKDVRLPARTPASIGTFVLTGENVRFDPVQGVELKIKDQPVTSDGRFEG